jgi:excisionase family DNA binding protein
MPDSSATTQPAKLYGAADLAKWCQADVKTIHNWADAGKIPHHRTPGRHLRFRAPDVRAFMLKHGYELPPELADPKGATS